MGHENGIPGRSIFYSSSVNWLTSAFDKQEESLKLRKKYKRTLERNKQKMIETDSTDKNIIKSKQIRV